MFAWFARKQRTRAKALETYLSHFNAGELAYLKNFTLTGLAPSSYDREDAFISVDLSTYLHAEWLAATGQIENSPRSRARARAKYRMRLARNATPTKIKTYDVYLQNIVPHRLEEPALTEDAEERLGAHWIVLTRLYADPTNAPTLPELEDIGEGTGWLPR